MFAKIEALSTRLANGYAQQSAALEEHFMASSAADVARSELLEAKQRIIREYAEDPKALGGNEAARAAKLDELTAKDRAVVARAEEDERQSRHALELAKLEVQAASTQLRVLELLAGSFAREGVPA